VAKRVRVVAAAIVRNGRVLAARRAPDAARGGLWELPGGKVELGESDALALVREIREELGADIVVDGFLGEASHDYGDIHITLAAWACRPRAGTGVTPRLRKSAHPKSCRLSR